MRPQNTPIATKQQTGEMLMSRAYYSKPIKEFIRDQDDNILGALARNNSFSLEETQRNSWKYQISILKKSLRDYDSGRIYFEFDIPRMGKRVDNIVIIEGVIFVLEFKCGSSKFEAQAIDQVWDYALDLKNFHEPSHECLIVPILIATESADDFRAIGTTPNNDKVLIPIRTNAENLRLAIDAVLSSSQKNSVDSIAWEHGRYCPTPTIIEAAMALYNGHSVTEISRSDAGAINLNQTSELIGKIISSSKKRSIKSICFVTGVPGAGKTLVGLNIATKHRKSKDLHSVFLSGNGPLVAILREALARDNVRREKERGVKLRKGNARSAVSAFVQNVHHFRDDCLVDPNAPPIEHVALFDEAQRAWNLNQTANFMKRKKKRAGFNQSEPEFLISCLDRHSDWAVIVCLVGGGQEINTGEAGIGEWIDSLNRSFPDWHVYVSPRLTDSEYGAGKVLERYAKHPNVFYKDELHLSVSMRSFRAENVSLLVKQLLDLESDEARNTLKNITSKYPIVVTRDLIKAKRWLKEKARGSERYGMVVSSQAERLKPYAMNVKAPIDPIHWFLDEKDDVRSSYYLEDVATEFHIQGLELDWACVVWDADFRYSEKGWGNWSFRGDRWNRILKEDRKTYLKNAYRVLLTRARQGMVIVVPPGDEEDPTRAINYYDPTFKYLKQIGFSEI